MSATEWEFDGDEAAAIGEALEAFSLWKTSPAGKDEEEEEEDEDDEDEGDEGDDEDEEEELDDDDD